MKNLFFAFGLFVLCLFPFNRAAASRIFVPEPAEPVSVEIHSDSRGRLAMDYDRYSRGNSDFYIIAQPDERYEIRVRNNSRRRLGLVISVDGLNIISGKTSYHRPNESMYLLEPGQTGSFTGWRQDYDSVARFYFTEAADSYAARTGQFGRPGQICVAVFYEREPVIVRFESSKSSDAELMREAPQAGTGYGENSYAPVRTADFNPESFAARMIRIGYGFDRTPVIYRKHDFAEPPR